MPSRSCAKLSTRAAPRTLAEGHRKRLRAQGRLADVYRAQGKLQQARALVDKSVLAAEREALGAKVDTMLMLELLRAALGRMSERSARCIQRRRGARRRLTRRCSGGASF